MTLCCFAIEPLKLVRQRYGGRFRGKHVPNTLVANDILVLAILQNGHHVVKRKQKIDLKWTKFGVYALNFIIEVKLKGQKHCFITY